MKHLTSRHNPLVLAYRALADGSDRRQILIDGIHLAAEARRAGVPVADAIVAASALEVPEIAAIVAALQDAGVEVCSASAPVMAAVSPVRSSSPIVARAPRRAPPLESLFAPAPALVVCAVDIQDPGNAGAIVRVAEAGGASGVALAGASADPFGWKALRGAMGSAFRLPVLHPCETVGFLQDATRRGCRIIATVPRGGLPPDACDLQQPVVILVGGEGPGLPAEVIAAANVRVSIPMTRGVESLNTAVCAALLVYEARRQRSGHAVPHRA